MAKILAECGIGCTRRATVGDNRERMRQTFEEALTRADILITIGGLGPTLDDLTRDMIAESLGDEMLHDDAYEQQLRDWFERRSVRWTESIARQADRPASATFIENRNGTAPGLHCVKNGKVVIALPGPKGEFDPMADGAVRKILEDMGQGVIFSRTLRIVGMGESHVEDLVRDLMESENPTVAPYAHTGEVHLRLTARVMTREEGIVALDPIEAEIRSRLGSNVFGSDDESLETIIVRRLTERGETLALAESMTGGGLATRITAVPGASQILLGSYVVYTAAAKVEMLGISSALISEEGVVSAKVAEALAVSARERLKATYAIGITGNAGPTAEPGGQPVGKVFVALARAGAVVVEELQMRGVRADIQRRTEQVALGLLRDALA
jgi:nicotinamide-nucleotide amidase